jgi:hypothetical protein
MEFFIQAFVLERSTDPIQLKVFLEYVRLRAIRLRVLVALTNEERRAEVPSDIRSERDH